MIIANKNYQGENVLHQESFKKSFWEVQVSSASRK